MFVGVTGQGGEGIDLGQPAQPDFDLPPEQRATGFDGKGELGFPEEEYANDSEHEIVTGNHPGIELSQTLDGLRSGNAIAPAFGLHSTESLTLERFVLKAAKDFRQPLQVSLRKACIADHLANRTEIESG